MRLDLLKRKQRNTAGDAPYRTAYRCVWVSAADDDENPQEEQSPPPLSLEGPSCLCFIFFLIIKGSPAALVAMVDIDEFAG